MAPASISSALAECAACRQEDFSELLQGVHVGRTGFRHDDAPIPLHHSVESIAGNRALRTTLGKLEAYAQRASNYDVGPCSSIRTRKVTIC
jgi:hypothetical protein